MYYPIYPKIKGTLFSLLLLITFKANAQCFTTTYRVGGTFTTENPGSLNFDFANLSNVSTSNDAYSTAGSLLTLLVGNTYYLKATNFGFSFPSYASICGIRVQVEKRANGLGLWGEITDNQVRIIKGGTILGNNKATATAWATSDVTTTYGGASDLWGTSFTSAEVNASNFGIAISAHIAGVLVAPDAQIDNIRIAIDYHLLLPVKLAYFNISKVNNRAKLEWKTTEEEDNAYISLERSFNNENNWREIKRYELSLNNQAKVYTYEDELVNKAKYAYRLKMITRTGAITYSDVKTVTATDEKTFAVYPNPASNFIVIDGATTKREVIITDAFARKWILPVIKSGVETAQVNIQSLPKGIYFINDGYQQGKFIKE